MENSSFAEVSRRYLNLLWQWGWLLVLASLLAGGTAYLTSAHMTPVYQASTLLLVNEAPSTKALDYTAVITSERLAHTYAELMTTRPVLEGVNRRLDLDLSVSDLQGAIMVAPVPDTQLIRVEVENTNPELAARIANALVAEFAEQNQADQEARYASSKQNLETELIQLDKRIEETSEALATSETGAGETAEHARLEESLARYQASYASLLQSYEQVRLAEAQSTATIVQKEPAMAPALPVRPNKVTNTLLAAVAGLLAALGLIFLVEALDDTLREPQEMERLLGLPVLGLIAHHPKGRPVAAAQPHSLVAEAFRGLRTNVEFTGVDRPLHSLLVTSPYSLDGKSTVAANLAIVLAQSGLRVVLADADLRRPDLHCLFGLPNREGLSNLFPAPGDARDRTIDLDEALQRTETPGLRVLTSGRVPPNPAELLGSEHMQHILEQAGQTADILVFDSPPVLEVTDAAVLARRVEGVILVVKAGVTKLAAGRQAAEQLRRVGANVLGVALNDGDARRWRYAYHDKDYFSTDNNQRGKWRGRRALARTREGVK